MTAHLPLIVIELVLVFGGALAFGWWQLRSVKKDREKAARDKAARAEIAKAADSDASHER